MYTSTPCEKIGRHFPRLNKSPTLETSVHGLTHLPSVRQRAGTSSSTQSSTPQFLSLSPDPGTAHGSFLLSNIMIPLFFQVEDLLSSQIAQPELHVAHDDPVRRCRGARGTQWYGRTTCLFEQIDSFTTAYYTIAAVMLSSQHPSTHTGVESIQLIYSGRVLRALSDVARQCQCQHIFGGNFKHCCDQICGEWDTQMSAIK